MSRIDAIVPRAGAFGSIGRSETSSPDRSRRALHAGFERRRPTAGDQRLERRHRGPVLLLAREQVREEGARQVESGLPEHELGLRVEPDYAVVREMEDRRGSRVEHHVQFEQRARQRLALTLDLGRVLERVDRLLQRGDVRSLGLDRPSLHEAPHRLAVAPEQHDFAAGRLVRTHHRHARDLARHPVAAVDAQVPQRHADHFAVAVAEHLGELAIGEEDLPGHRLRDADRHRFEQCLLVPQGHLQLLLEDLPVREVLEDDQEVAMPVARGKGSRAALGPDNPPFAMDQPALGRVRSMQPPLHLLAHAAVRRPVVGVHQVVEVLADQVLGRIPQRVARRTIDTDGAEAGVEQQRRHGALVEQSPEPLGALAQGFFGQLARADVPRQQQDELAASLLHPLHDRLDRELGAAPGPEARLAMVPATRAQFVVHHLEAAVCQPDVDRRQREALDLVALVAQRLQGGFVGVEHLAMPVHLEHHLAHGLERLSKCRQRTLREALAIDAFEQDEDPAERSAGLEHGRVLHAQPRPVAERIAVLCLPRRRLAARWHLPNFLDQRADRREAGRVVKAQANDIGRGHAEQRLEVVVPHAIAQRAIQHADADGRRCQQRADEHVRPCGGNRSGRAGWL